MRLGSAALFLFAYLLVSDVRPHSRLTHLATTFVLYFSVANIMRRFTFRKRCGTFCNKYILTQTTFVAD